MRSGSRFARQHSTIRCRGQHHRIEVSARRVGGASAALRTCPGRRGSISCQQQLGFGRIRDRSRQSSGSISTRQTAWRCPVATAPRPDQFGQLLQDVGQALVVGARTLQALRRRPPGWRRRPPSLELVEQLCHVLTRHRQGRRRQPRHVCRSHDVHWAHAVGADVGADGGLVTIQRDFRVCSLES